MDNNAQKQPVMEIEGLKVLFHSAEGLVRAVEGVNITVNAGECVAVVGESGCGKSVTGLSMMRLLQSPPAVWRADKLMYTDAAGNKIDILTADEKVLEKLRGADISMIYQDPSSALNPVMTIGEQIAEVYKYHTELTPKEARAAGIEMLKKVGIPAAEDRYDQYPHELSGGMKQRVLIAMAMACKPRLLIADEPTTALDVTIQAQILDLLRELCANEGTALVMITHDLGVVADIADYMYVMYCGKIMEQGRVDEILTAPRHPYTRGLIASIPRSGERLKRFHQIPFNVPSPMNKPHGCYFHNRCDVCSEICKNQMPALTDIGRNEHKTRCHNERRG
ncbi:MAG: ABC transporter ATP-binding protein [Clostridiales bacterium]|nr:ABC transporter ATP-binding protein [Clostridiales bacterium]